MAEHLVLLTGRVEGEGPGVLPLRRGDAVRIGRGEGNDFILPGAGAPEHCCDLRPVDGGWELVDGGTESGTRVGGRRIETERIGPGVLFAAGDALLLLTSDEYDERPLPGGAMAGREARLRPILTEDASFDAEGITIPAGASVVIGRSPEADAALPDGTISRRHCQLSSRDDGWVLSDLNSSNGTFVGKERVKERPMRPGDVVLVGHTALVFEVAGDDGCDSGEDALEPARTPVPEAVDDAAPAAPPQEGTETVTALAGAVEPVASLGWRANAAFRALLGRIDPLDGEMMIRAALAFWVVLFFLMASFSVVREASLGMALILLFGAVGAYAIYTFIFVSADKGWIGEEEPDPARRRIRERLGVVCEQAEMPMPTVALAEDPLDINAFTYGFNAASARVVVTQGFLEHVQPTDEELDAVLAHEMGHIRHGDFVISTLMRFPIWLMDKVRWCLSLARFFARIVLNVISSVAVGWIGLFMILGALFFVFYLSIWIGVLTACIFVSMVALNMFEREREYLADAFSATLSADPGPLQMALAKLESASEHVQSVLEKRFASAAEGEEVDLNVSAEEPQDAGSRVGKALAMVPNFWGGVAAGEWAMSHPLTPKRIYYLANPDQRRRPFAAVLERLEGLLQRLLKGEPGEPEPLVAALLVGVSMGLLCAMPLTEWIKSMPSWLEWSIEIASLIGPGVWLGIRASRRRWTGQVFLRQTLLTTYVMATVFLVAGVLFRYEAAMMFPFMFLVSTVFYGTSGMLAAWFLNRRARSAEPAAE